MPTTQLADAFVSDVYLSYMAVNDIEASVLVTAGAVARTSKMDDIARSGGLTATVPYWQDLDASSPPNMSNDDPADMAVPERITSGTMSARKAWLNKGWSAMDLVSELTGSDPMTHIRARFATWWVRQFERRVLYTAIGVLNDSVASHASDMLIDGSAAAFQADMVADAMTQFSDLDFNPGVIMVHPEIHGTMVKADDIVYEPDSQGKLTVPTYRGMRVWKSRLAPVTGTGDTAVYTSIIFGAGSVGVGAFDGGAPFLSGEGTPRVAAEIEREPRSGNGGGEESLWERKTWLIHPFGYNWAGEATLVEFSPTLQDLDNATSWDRATGIDREMIPLAFVNSRRALKTYV